MDTNLPEPSNTNLSIYGAGVVPVENTLISTQPKPSTVRQPNERLGRVRTERYHLLRVSPVGKTSQPFLQRRLRPRKGTTNYLKIPLDYPNFNELPPSWCRMVSRVSTKKWHHSRQGQGNFPTRCKLHKECFFMIEHKTSPVLGQYQGNTTNRFLCK